MIGTIFGLLFSLFLLFIVGQALWGPLRFLSRLGLHFLLGAATIFLVNLAAGWWGCSIGLNLFSAFTVGVLGAPGLALLLALKFFFS